MPTQDWKDVYCAAMVGLAGASLRRATADTGTEHMVMTMLRGDDDTPAGIAKRCAALADASVEEFKRHDDEEAKKKQP